MFAPAPREPANVLDDGVDVFLLFLFRIRIVEPQMAPAAEFRCYAEVQADALGVSDMQIPVRLGGESRHHPSVPLVCLKVLGHNLPDKVEAFRTSLGGVFLVVFTL